MIRILLSWCMGLGILSALCFIASFLLDLSVEVILIIKFGMLIGFAGSIILWGMQKLFPSDQVAALLGNFTLLSVTIVILLIIGESTVRYALDDITTTADGFSYFTSRWEKEHVTLNSRGFRGNEYSLQKPQKTYRIAVIGDSFTYGQGINANERFTHLIDQALNERKAGFEVLNFGRLGAEMVHHVEILQEEVLKTNPDFILLQWYINDVEGKDKSSRPKFLPLLPSSTLHSFLHRSSAFYYLLEQQWTMLQKILNKEQSYIKYLEERYQDPNNFHSQKASEAVAEFIRICKEQGVSVGLVAFPFVVSNIADAYPLDFLHNRILSQFRHENIPCLDLREIFAPYTIGQDYKQLWVNRFDGHASAMANRIVAEALLKKFGPVWIAGKESL